MKDIKCMGFQKEFPTVNLKMKKEDEIGYEYSKLILYALETERGFKVKKIGKTTKKGTKVTYELIKSKEDAIKYKELLVKMCGEFNKKWQQNIKVK